MQYLSHAAIRFDGMQQFDGARAHGGERARGPSAPPYDRRTSYPCGAVVREDDSLFGAFAAGWSGIICVVALALVYTIFHEFTSVTYLSWYFCGIMCARRTSLVQTPAARP